MNEVNVPKTQRRLSELELEEFGKIKAAIEKLGVKVEIAKKENMASWLTFDPTVEMVDVFATGELNKEHILIFQKEEWELLEKLCNNAFNLQHLENKVKVYRDNDKLKERHAFENVRRYRSEFFIKMIWEQKKRMTEVFFEENTDNKIKILKKEKNAKDEMLIDLSLEESKQFSEGKILSFLANTKSKNLEVEVEFLTKEEFDNMKLKKEKSKQIVEVILKNFETMEFESYQDCVNYLNQLENAKKELEQEELGQVLKNKKGNLYVKYMPEFQKTETTELIKKRFEKSFLSMSYSVERMIEDLKNDKKPHTGLSLQLREILKKEGFLDD